MLAASRARQKAAQRGSSIVSSFKFAVTGLDLSEKIQDARLKGKELITPGTAPALDHMLQAALTVRAKEQVGNRGFGQRRGFSGTPGITKNPGGQGQPSQERGKGCARRKTPPSPAQNSGEFIHHT